MTRCKFNCESVTKFANGSKVNFRAVTHGSPENEQFLKWTPNANMELQLVNDEVAKQFEPGKEYYIDITEVNL